MSVTIRPYRRGGFEVDIQVAAPDGSKPRIRRKAPVSSRSAAKRWAEALEAKLLTRLTTPVVVGPIEKEVPTLTEFAPRFMSGYAVANREKPSSIAAKETILRVHLIPALGSKRLDRIGNEDIQSLKARLVTKSPKTVNNVLSVLNTALRIAVDWDVMDSMPCTIKLVKTMKPGPKFHDFAEFEKLVVAARAIDTMTTAIILLGGEAGLRLGEIVALEWSEVDLKARRICVTRSDWKGHITAPKGGRIRYVPMTKRLTDAVKTCRHLRGDRIVCQRDGSALTQKIMRNVVKRAARRAAVQHQGVHVLRHTFCSHLAMRGAPARAIQELAGHESLATTQRYMHLSPAATDAAIALLDRRVITADFGDILETADRGAAKS